MLLTAMNDMLDKGEIDRDDYDRYGELSDRLYDIGNTEIPDTATPSVYPVYLRLKKPAVFEAKNVSWDYIVPHALESTDRTKHDGIIWREILDNPSEYTSAGPSTTVAVFDPLDIKSAIGNDGLFSSVDADISKQYRSGVRKEFNPNQPRGRDGRWIDMELIDRAVDKYKSKGNLSDVRKLADMIGDDEEKAKYFALIASKGVLETDVQELISAIKEMRSAFSVSDINTCVENAYASMGIVSGNTMSTWIKTTCR